MEDKLEKKYGVMLLTESTLDIILQIEGDFPILGGGTRLVKKMSLEPGGEGNIFIVFNRLGGNILPVGPLSNDHYGKFLRHSYEEQGIDISQLRMVEGFETPVANCIIDEKGCHTFVSKLAGREFVQSEKMIELLNECKGLFVSGYHLVDDESDFYKLDLQLIEAAKEQGLPLFFDPGPLVNEIRKEALDKVIKNATVISLNHEEAQLLTGLTDEEKAALELKKRTDGIVAVKSGGKGCCVASDEGCKWYPGFQVKVIDTMGAGDSFIGALMYAWTEGFDKDTCFILANASGAVKASKLGTGSQVPTFEEIVAILEENGYNIPKICKKTGKFTKLELSC